jgi:hypothetical protein
MPTLRGQEDYPAKSIDVTLSDRGNAHFSAFAAAMRGGRPRRRLATTTWARRRS